jgi:hypothetical protein
MAELSLHGEIRQVPEVLWFRRQMGASSVDRQRSSLFGAHPAPRSFVLPPAIQHARALYSNYVRRSELPSKRVEMIRMIGRYVATSSMRHFRKSALRHRWGVAVESLFWARKRIIRAFHVAVFHLLVSTKAARSRAMRILRRSLFNVLVLSRRIGLRQ